MPYDERGGYYSAGGGIAPGGTPAAGLTPEQIYGQLQQLRSDQTATKYGGIKSWSVADMPEFQALDPAMQEKVTAAGKTFVQNMPKDSGWGSFLTAAALPLAALYAGERSWW